VWGRGSERLSKVESGQGAVKALLESTAGTLAEVRTGGVVDQSITFYRRGVCVVGVERMGDCVRECGR
jgi:hypothetical protein